MDPDDSLDPAYDDPTYDRRRYIMRYYYIFDPLGLDEVIDDMARRYDPRRILRFEYGDKTFVAVEFDKDMRGSGFETRARSWAWRPHPYRNGFPVGDRRPDAAPRPEHARAPRPGPSTHARRAGP